jgi:chromosome segregation ATPase
MDSLHASPVAQFRSPPRILIPKLVASRDGWKRKATQRKTKLQAALITIRDLTASRQLWKNRAHEAEANVHARTEQLRHTQAQLQHAQDALAQLQADQKKVPPAQRN